MSDPFEPQHGGQARRGLSRGMIAFLVVVGVLIIGAGICVAIVPAALNQMEGGSHPPVTHPPQVIYRVDSADLRESFSIRVTWTDNMGREQERTAMTGWEAIFYAGFADGEALYLHAEHYQEGESGDLHCEIVAGSSGTEVLEEDGPDCTVQGTYRQG